MDISLELNGLESAIAALQSLQAGDYQQAALKAQVQAFSDLERQYFTSVVTKLPFKRPPKPVRPYGIESGALFSDLLNLTVDGSAIGTGSDLIYAGYQQGLAEAKGSSLLAPDEAFLDLGEQAISDAIDALWSE